MKQWYFIHTYSGHENKVVESLQARIREKTIGEQVMVISGCMCGPSRATPSRQAV